MNMAAAYAKLRAACGIMHGSRAFGGPPQVHLQLTNRCNLRCIHCYFYSPYLAVPAVYPLRVARRTGGTPPSATEIKRIMKMDADPRRTRAVIDEILGMGTRRWQIGGNGEPFLYKGVFDVIEILKRSGCYCLANTNGTLIDRAAADELIKTGFDDLRITTMAGTAGAYARTHPGSSEETFERLKQTLLYIADRKLALKVSAPEITLVLIVIAHNAAHIREFARFAVETGAARVLFRPVDDIEDPGLVNLVPGEEAVETILDQLRDARAFLESKGVGHNIDYFMKSFDRQLDTGLLYRHIPCYYGWLTTIIEPDGSVYPCCRCYKPLGNIQECGFAGVWNGTAYRRFRNAALHIRNRTSPLPDCDCGSCIHHTANLRVYGALHPVKSRSATLKELCPASEDESL
jgi:radical SAM protein with 4Fe4S-binding SPASM domain